MSAPVSGRVPDTFLTAAVVWRDPRGRWEITATSSSAGPRAGEVVVRAGTDSLRHDTDGLHLDPDQVQAMLMDLTSAGRVARCTVAIDASATSRARITAVALGHNSPEPTGAAS